jgi:cytoskeletal protein RodZ
MFSSKTTRTVSKTRKKNIGSFLAVVFCTLVIVSSIGTSFRIKNSYAQAQQQQLEPRQAPTIAYQSPSSNNLQVSSASNNQPLCAAGVCNQSSAPASTTQTTSAHPTTTQPTTTQPTTTQPTTTQPHSSAGSSTTSTTNVDPTQIANVDPRTRTRQYHKQLQIANPLP